MTFAIIKNAEIPQNKAGGKSCSYPFPQMEIGDGFDAPRDMGNKKGQDQRQNSISNSAKGYARRHNPTAKFTTRILDENTIRCVRIA